MPTARDFASRDDLWSDYRAWLERSEVVGDQLCALVHPHAAPRGLPDPEPGWPGAPTTAPGDRDARLLVVAWTWPEVDPSQNAEVLERGASGNLVRAIVSGHMQILLLAAAEHADVAPDDLAASALHETGISRPRFELLLAGQTTVDVATLVALCRAFGISHNGVEWLIEPAHLLGARVARHRALFHLVEEATLAASSAVDIARCADVLQKTASSTDPDVHINPKVLGRRMSKGHQRRDAKTRKSKGPYDRQAYKSLITTDLFWPLHDALINQVAPEVTYSMSEIKAIQAQTRRRHRFGGLPPSAETNPEFWSNGATDNRSHVRAWQSAGYEVAEKTLVRTADGSPDLEHSKVVFREMPGRRAWLPNRNNWRIWTPPTKPLNLLDIASSGRAFNLQTRAFITWPFPTTAVPATSPGKTATPAS